MLLARRFAVGQESGDNIIYLSGLGSQLRGKIGTGISSCFIETFIKKKKLATITQQYVSLNCSVSQN